MSSAKNATRGPWTVDASDEDAIEVVGTPVWGCERFGKRGRWSVCTLDDLLGDHPKEVKANARLIAEAGTVLHETGLTPRQLAEQRAELLEALEQLLYMKDGQAARSQGSTSPYAKGAGSAIEIFAAEVRSAIANATQQRNATGGEG